MGKRGLFRIVRLPDIRPDVGSPGLLTQKCRAAYERGCQAHILDNTALGYVTGGLCPYWLISKDIDSCQGSEEICGIPENPGTVPHGVLENRSNLCRVFLPSHEPVKVVLLAPELNRIHFFRSRYGFSRFFTGPFPEYLSLGESIAPQSVSPMNTPGHFPARE